MAQVMQSAVGVRWFDRFLLRFGYARPASLGLRLEAGELITDIPDHARRPLRGIGIPTVETLSQPPRLLAPCGPLPERPRRLAHGTAPICDFDDEPTRPDRASIVATSSKTRGDG